MRRPYQVLIIPYRKQKDLNLFAIFKRKDLNFWQWISGGVENNETFLQAAKREIYEEIKIESEEKEFIKLDSMTMISVDNIGKYKWCEKIFVIPEYSFGLEIKNNIIIGKEHSEYKWVKYKEAYNLLKYDSNKTALWELNKRLERR
jgi:dihydroneopterin triphosphate diphosphatase